MSTAILFRKCLGYTDVRAFGTQRMITDPRSQFAGQTELIDCLNLTITPDGCLEKVAPLVPVLMHSAPITNISAGDRFIYQDGIDTKEWDGTQVATIGAVLSGPVVHTPIDVRVSGAAKVYKSTLAGAGLSEALLGDLSNLPDRDKKPYYAQRAYKQAFTYNGHIYGINAVDPRFLEWSAWTHYDAWAIGDDFQQVHTSPILQAGAIPGALICTHTTGVTVYAGTNPNDFVKKFYPCKVIDGTLYSGFIGKTYTNGQQSRTYGYCHVFLCADGVHVVTEDGSLINLTEAATNYLDTLNSSYTSATLQGAKYLTFGDNLCIEYDFETNSVLKRSAFGVKSAAIWQKQNYYAVGSTIAITGANNYTTGDFAASLTLPFSDLSTAGTKSVEALYFTGRIDGNILITATDQTGSVWQISETSPGLVSNYRIKTPRGMLGNHISFKIECTSGAFRMEELRAVMVASKRSR